MSQQRELSLKSAEVQYKLAAVWQSKGQFNRAIAGYEEAVRLRPDYVPAHLELGALLVHLGQPAEAIRVYQRALQWNPRETRFEQKLAEFDRQDTWQVPAPQGSSEPARRGLRHVMLYTDCSGIGGVEQCNHMLMGTLVEAGYRVTCAQGRASHHLIAAGERQGVRYHWLEDDDIYDLSKPARALTDHREPNRILSENRPDLVIFADGCPLSNLTAKQAAGRLGIPYMIAVHCVTPAWAEQFWPYLSKLPPVFERARAVVAVSTENLELLHRLFGLAAGRGKVVYNGRPSEYFEIPNPSGRRRMREVLGVPDDGVLVCTVASVEERKGYQYQLEAIKQLRQSAVWPDLYFAWVGAGTLEPQLRAAVEYLGVADQVRFLGERSDISDVLDAADVFVLPSEYEGMPLAVMEAMAKGLPVIATSVSGIPEELGNTGKLIPGPAVDPQSAISQLVTTIQAWAADVELRRAIGRACKKRAAEMFRAERMLEEYLQVIEHALLES